MDYQTIKQEARARGQRVTDLIALAPQNDPFYTGTPGDIAKAEWFSNLWQRFGYGQGVHLRRVHYQAVSQDPPILKTNGKPYENTLNDWNYLGLAAKYARYLELVPASYFVDRRNPDAILNAQFYGTNHQWYDDTTPGYNAVEYEDWEAHNLTNLPTLPDLPENLPDLPSFDVQGYSSVQQDYLIEVWAEKTTMNDVLEPLCRQYSINLITGAGELSITAVLDLMKRAAKNERPARILYISDYDPAGLGMPISVAVKIQFFQTTRPEYADLDIRLEPIVLTSDQVKSYNLPRVPVKDSDKRKANWILTQGAGQVELDALEALHPGELAQIVHNAASRYYDPKLIQRARSAKWELGDTLDDIRLNIQDAYQEEIGSLQTDYDNLRASWAETRARFSELVAGFQEEINAYTQQLDDIKERGQETYGKVLDDLEDVDVDMPELPTPDLLPDSDTLLYDSRRDYFGQLDFYKTYRGKDKDEI